MSRKVSVAWPALKMAAIKLYDHLGIAMLLSLLRLAIGVTPLIFVLRLLFEKYLERFHLEVGVTPLYLV